MMTIRKSPLCMLLLFAFAQVAGAAETREFKHPGVICTQEVLDGLKGRIASNPMIKTAYEKLASSPYVDVQRPHTPFAIVKIAASGTCPEETAFRNDSQAAYATALLWAVTGDAKYRDKSMAILNDWAATYEKMPESPQAWLESAWAVPVWVGAADIIRYHRKGAAGWKPDQIAAFDQFLGKLLTPARQALIKGNNWGTSATLAILSAAVYQNDEATYQEALKLHREQLAYISKENGALGKDYLRDPWHPQYTLIAWTQICEIAWNQGDDLYGVTVGKQTQPRLAVCLEHFAKLFVGELPDPKGLQKGKYLGGHKGKQSYDMAYNHYIHRKKMAASMPTFAAMVPQWRPGGLDTHFLGWDTLTHGDFNAVKK